MTRTVFAKGMSLDTIPETKVKPIIDQEKATADMRRLVRGFEEIELPEEFNLALTLYDVCKMVLHLDDDQARAALGDDLYKRFQDENEQPMIIDKYLLEIMHYWPELSEWQKIKFTFRIWFDTSWAGKAWHWLAREFTAE